MNKKVIAAIAAFGLTAGAFGDEVTFNELPKKAKQTINRNLHGGVVKSIDRQAKNGRTLYEVEIRRQGQDREIWVDADGKLWPKESALSVHSERVFDKNDGKILGVVPNPADDNDFEAEARVGDSSVEIDADADVNRSGDNELAEDVFDKNDGKILDVVPTPDSNEFEAEAEIGDEKLRVEADRDVEVSRDRGFTEDVFDKNDGKILNIFPAPSRDREHVSTQAEIEDREIEIEADTDLRDNDLQARGDIDVDVDDREVAVEANEGRGKGIFRKGDGKILGIPIPGRRSDNEVFVEVRPENESGTKNVVTRDADGSLDTDDGDGRILGVPKRGFETLRLSELPAPVQETIRREAQGYSVVEIERATLNNQSVYEVDIERDGGNRELHIAADGQIVKDSENTALGGSPGAERGANKQ